MPKRWSLVVIYADGSRETVDAEYVEFQTPSRPRPGSEAGPQAPRGGKRIEAGKIDRIERKKS